MEKKKVGRGKIKPRGKGLAPARRKIVSSLIREFVSLFFWFENPFPMGTHKPLPPPKRKTHNMMVGKSQNLRTNSSKTDSLSPSHPPRRPTPAPNLGRIDRSIIAISPSPPTLHPSRLLNLLNDLDNILPVIGQGRSRLPPNSFLLHNDGLPSRLIPLRCPARTPTYRTRLLLLSVLDYF